MEFCKTTVTQLGIKNKILIVDRRAKTQAYTKILVLQSLKNLSGTESRRIRIPALRSD